MFRYLWISSRVRKRLYTEPEADVVHWNGKILQCRVAEKQSEDIKDVMAIVGKGVGVDDRVEMYCKQSGSNEQHSLQRLGGDGVRGLAFNP